MEMKILCKAYVRRHKGSLAGVFALLFIVSVSLVTTLTVWESSGRYVREEMERLGFGDLTAWASQVNDITQLTDEIGSLDTVEKTGVQKLIYSEYEIKGQKSDSEGQLVVYEPEDYAYRIFLDDLSGYQAGEAVIRSGELYAPISLRSMCGAEIGDEISFPIARNGVAQTFTIKGWFEDPFMGSSMIGMKSFLICGGDHGEILRKLSAAGNDGLARDGFMIHIFKDRDSEVSIAQWNAMLNQETRLSQFAEFTHSRNAIEGFMLTLQNVFTGFLSAFAAALFLASMVVLRYGISGAIERDTPDMGALKTVGFTTGRLQKAQAVPYIFVILAAVAFGVLAAPFAAGGAALATLTTTGLLFPVRFPLWLCLLSLLPLMLLLLGSIFLKVRKIGAIAPVEIIRGTVGKASEKKRRRFPIRRTGLPFFLAVRQLAAGKRRYLSVGASAALLVFFASFMGYVDSWLGADGKGLMDAFNPADLHIAAQPMGEATSEDVERTIMEYTDITDSYMLAMPGVSVDGVDHTANVITEPKRFHLLSGRTCLEADEIVLTESVAADLGVGIGDTVTVGKGAGSMPYRVSGIYQCANDMGANVGLSREGYAKIGRETAGMWCVHYFLADASKQQEVMRALEDLYGGDVYLHENSWPGLFGILSAMKWLMIFMYAVVTAFVFVVTALSAGRLLAMEQKDLGICRAIGFSPDRLRLSFSLRFGIVSGAGSVLGSILAVLFTDPLVAALLRQFGISDFSGDPSALDIMLPIAAVTGLFMLFAWLDAGKIKKMRLTVLVARQ